MVSVVELFLQVLEREVERLHRNNIRLKIIGASERFNPALLERISRPLIVLDPARVSGLGRDVTLEVARRAAELRSAAMAYLGVVR